MIKTNPDTCKPSTGLPANLRIEPFAESPTTLPMAPSHSISSAFLFSFPNYSSKSLSSSLSSVDKHPMDFLTHINPASNMDFMEARREQWEITPKEGESPDISRWPTVVDSRIPFTTYLQNLTRTLRMAAAKRDTSTSVPSNENDTKSIPTVTTPSSTYRSCLSPPHPYDVASSPRSQGCGSQAEPDSSCCDDEPNAEPRDEDNDADNNSQMDYSERSSTGNDFLQKTTLQSPKFRSSISSESDETYMNMGTKNTIPKKQSQRSKSLTGLVMPPAHAFNTLAETSRGSFSAAVMPFSPLPVSPLSASLPYHFRPNLHHAVLEKDTVDEDQQRQQHHHNHQHHRHEQQQQPNQSPQSPTSETSVLGSSLPASLLHYHLQGQRHKQHHHHHQEQQQQYQQHLQQLYQRNEWRTPPSGDPVQSSRLFFESTFFQPLSSASTSARSNKPSPQDFVFSKMLMDSRPQPGTSLMTSETTQAVPLPGSRGFSNLTPDVGSLLQTSFLGLGGLGMRRPHTDKPVPVKKYKCDVCQKAFSRSNTLVTHKRIHTGDKPFKCEVCGRAFRQPGNLTRHRLTHTTHKPYVCQVCNKAFNRASNLNTHIRTHTNFRQFPCAAGSKTFPPKADLTSHVFAHSGEQHRGFPH